MKKLLALVLALVMSLSLVTISNADFKDADKIDYNEAVDVMNAIGVLVGDENGNFNAKDTLTRAQAAKIIAYLLLGNKTAEGLAGSGKFTDVAAGNWAAGFVDYCAATGIVAGVGDNKFDPNGSLTGLQFAKMLLIALGYDAKIEGFVGTDWAINTSKLATQVGLFDEISKAASAPLTREEAAQMTLNTIKAPLVEYATKGGSISVNGATVTIGGSNAEFKTTSTKNKADQTIYADVLNSNKDAYIVEFAEQYYSKLVLVNNGSDTSDPFGRPANKWTWNGQEVGTYTQSETLLYTAKVEKGQIYKDLGLGKTTTAEYYIDGMKQSIGVTLSKSDTNQIGGNGTETYVYYFDDGSVTVCEVNWYVGDVAAVYKATASKDAYVTIASRDGAQPSGNYTTESYSMDNVVLYTYSYQPGEGIQNVELAPASIKGALTNYVTNKNATVGGTKYDYSNMIANEATSALMNRSIEVEIVLDKYGYVIDIDDAGVRNYAVITKIKASAGTYNDDTLATLLFTDGTTKAVTLTKDSPAVGSSTGELGVGDIVSYTINSSKEYKLAEVADVKTFNTVNTTLVTNGSGSMDTTAFGSGKDKANGKTIFLVKNSAGGYNVYTGVKEVPTIKTQGTVSSAININSYVEAGATAAYIVYIDAENYVDVNSNKTIFLFWKGSVTETKDEKIGNYYEYSAWIDGEETKLKVDSTQAAGMSGPAIYTTVSYNDDGIAKLGGNVGSDVVNNGTATVAAKNGVIGLNGSFYGYTKDCKVFYINSNNEVIASSVGAIATDTNDIVWYHINNNDVDHIFIKEVGVVAATYTVAGPASVTFALAKDGSYAATLAGVEEGTTVYVQASAAKKAVKSTTLTLTVVKAPTDTDKGIYSFKMPAVNVVAGDFTEAALYKVSATTTPVTVAGLTYTITAPTADLYVEANKMVDVQVTVLGVATGTTVATLTASNATAVSKPIATAESVDGQLVAAAATATTATFTPTNGEYTFATYNLKVMVDTNDVALSIA